MNLPASQISQCLEPSATGLQPREVEQYKHLMEVVGDTSAAVDASLRQHGKAHSQFQYALLDCISPVAGFTLLRNWRQTLAVIERTRDSLEEAWFNVRKQQAKQKRHEQRSDTSGDLHDVKAQECASRARRISRSMLGAIRKLVAYIRQAQQLEERLRAELGKSNGEPITEADWEADEERFHIKQAFSQAMLACRAYGRIDHGNIIYLDHIGVNPGLAQQDIVSFLRDERVEVSNNELVDRQWQFLEDMATKYRGCSDAHASRKGLVRTVPEALLGNGHECLPQV